MASIEDIIKRVPVYTELDRPEERIYAIQALYKQLLNVMDVVKSGGGGGGSTTLAGLEDVALYNPVTGQILKYNGSMWENHDDDGGTPGPDTVGTEQIIDNSVELEDLNDRVKDKIQKTYDISDESLSMDFDVTP